MRSSAPRASACAPTTAPASSRETEYTDLLAVCIQHEMDHLEGKLFVDYLSEMKRERIRKRLDKERKERAAAAPASAGRARRTY